MNKQRIIKFIDHLNNGELGHNVFDFTCVNEDKPYEDGLRFPENTCRTHGCALGELPIVFPEYFRFYYNQVYSRESNPVLDSIAVSKFFDIEIENSSDIFFRTHIYKIPESITRYDVANKLSNLLNRK